MICRILNQSPERAHISPSPVAVLHYERTEKSTLTITFILVQICPRTLAHPHPRKPWVVSPWLYKRRPRLARRKPYLISGLDHSSLGLRPPERGIATAAEVGRGRVGERPEEGEVGVAIGSGRDFADVFPGFSCLVVVDEAAEDDCG